MKWKILILLALTLQGCTGLQNLPESGKQEEENKTSLSSPLLLPLSWEHSASYRSEWSKTLQDLVTKNLDVYKSAKDIKEICPNWEKFSDESRIRAISELFVALSYYESGFNPKSQSVDVGTKNDKSSWSIGLYQISERDQVWVKADRVYSFNELLESIPNINLAQAIMIRQIQKYGKIILNNSDKGRYWAVLLKGNKYSKIPQILERVKTHGGC